MKQVTERPACAQAIDEFYYLNNPSLFHRVSPSRSFDFTPLAAVAAATAPQSPPSSSSSLWTIRRENSRQVRRDGGKERKKEKGCHSL